MPKTLTQHNKIYNWVVKQRILDSDKRGLSVDDDGNVDVLGSIEIQSKCSDGFPVKFGIIEVDFRCGHITLTSLKNGPIVVGRVFNASFNQLTQVDKSFPKIVHGMIYLDDNKISSLKNIHKYIERAQGLCISRNPLKSHILGIFFIRGFETFVFHDNPELEKIINKHLSGDRDVHACQEELIKAGFAEYAKL